MKKIILLLTLFILFVLQANSINNVIYADSNTLNPIKEYTIAEIKFKWLMNNYENDLSKNMFALSVGDKISIPGEKIASAFKSFFKQGLFSYGKILATKQTKDSIWLEIILKPAPIIYIINFVGITKSEQEELQKKLSIIPGTYLKVSLIKQTINQVKEFFTKRGFNKTEVEIKQKNNTTNKNQIILNIIINKNQKIKVSHIHIIGNNVFSNFTLKKMMKNTIEKFSFLENPGLIVRNFFNSNKFVKEKFDEDIKNIISNYNEKGYADVFITNKIVPINNNLVDIYLKINEGKKYFIRNINWIGNKRFSFENLNSILNIKSGDVYNQKKLNARLLYDEDAVSNLYYNNGYIFSSINPIETCIKNDSIDIEIRVFEGIQATINHIAINGNTKIYENVIRRELATKPGQLFSKKLLTRSVQNIAQMGHFDPETIDIQTIPNYETGKVDINYNLISKEKDQIEASVGLKDEKLVGSLCLKFSNFSFKNLIHPKKYNGIIPQGEGQTLTLTAQSNGHYYQSYGISFLEPWVVGNCPNSLLLNTNYVIQSDHFTTNNGHVRIFNFSSSYKRHLNWIANYFTLMPEISYQHCWLPNDCSNFPIDITNNFTFGLTLSRNSTNNSVYTSHGSIISLSSNTTFPHSILKNTEDYNMLQQKKSSTAKYYKFKFKSKSFVPLFNKNNVKHMPVLMNNIEYGFIRSYNQKYKPFEIFKMGGDGITNYHITHNQEIIGLRGYEFGVFPTKGDGYLYTKMVLELRYPLIFDQVSTIYGLSFVECGNIWETVKLFSLLDLKRSAGIGIRILLPMIGLIGFDWGYGFDRIYNKKTHGTNVSGAQFHFILGQEF